jgi:hypothetical protein
MEQLVITRYEIEHKDDSPSLEHVEFTAASGIVILIKAAAEPANSPQLRCQALGCAAYEALPYSTKQHDSTPPKGLIKYQQAAGQVDVIEFRSAAGLKVCITAPRAQAGQAMELACKAAAEAARALLFRYAGV